MDMGNQILSIRKEQGLTQEEFGNLFHVTRQTVSNWENKKSYPDLQTLVEISDRFDVSLDILLKGDSLMVKEIDKERALGAIKCKQSVVDFFTGSGTGILASCLFAPGSMVRTITIAVGLILISVGWYKKARCDKQVVEYLKEAERY